MAFFEQETIKRADGEDLSVPVVEDDATGKGDFLVGEAFHAGAREG